MMLNKFAIGLLVVFIGVLGYIFGIMQYQYNTILNDTLYTSEGFYRDLNEKRYGTRKEIIENIFKNSIDNNGYASSSQWNGIYYCEQVRTDQKDMKWIGGTYIKIGSNLFSKGKIITTCEQNNCQLNDKLPNIVNDGKNTFYKGEIISGFEYNNFIVLDEVNSVFTDKRKVYIQGKELPDMDWTTFSFPKKSIQEFKDKNYTYTFNYSGGSIQIQRVENK